MPASAAASSLSDVSPDTPTAPIWYARLSRAITPPATGTSVTADGARRAGDEVRPLDRPSRRACVS